MTTAIATSSVAFAAPFAVVLLCALLLILEDRREARLHKRMARDLDRRRVGQDFSPHIDQQEPRR